MIRPVAFRPLLTERLTLSGQRITGTAFTYPWDPPFMVISKYAFTAGCIISSYTHLPVNRTTKCPSDLFQVNFYFWNNFLSEVSNRGELSNPQYLGRKKCANPPYCIHFPLLHGKKTVTCEIYLLPHSIFYCNEILAICCCNLALCKIFLTVLISL